LLAVLFVATLTASAVSASHVTSLTASAVIADDDWCGNGHHWPWWWPPHPYPWPPEPDPWWHESIGDEIKGINSINNEAQIENIAEITSMK
jgi:hypothetical protein